MVDWREESPDPWPVKYPAEAPSQETEQPSQETRWARWPGVGKVDSGEVQKRLVWLLLAAEIGMLVVAACVLPLVFLNLPVKEEGVFGAILTQVGEWLGLSSQATCLIVGLPWPILLFTLGLNLWLVRWFRQRRRD
jgi:hypothetical protein